MSSQTIVVADNDSLCRELMQELLTDLAYPNVVCVSDAAAFTCVRATAADLIVMDINLRNRAQARTTLTLLRIDPLTAHIPVLICSTDRTLAQQHASHLEHLNCAVLAKPFLIDDLHDVLEALIPS